MSLFKSQRRNIYKKSIQFRMYGMGFHGNRHRKAQMKALVNRRFTGKGAGFYI